MALKPPEKKTLVQRYVPIVDWLPSYKWGKWFRYDILAALTVWALLVPEAMAYAGIAGVPPEIGLMTAPLALIGYAIFGSSRHLFVGPSSTVAIISASVVAPLAGGDGDLYLVLTIWLAIFTGVFFVGLGIAKMGWIANFMASSVLSGFMVGLAIVIATGQLDKILGIEAEGNNVVQDLRSMLEQFRDWDWPTIAIGAVALALLFVIEETSPKLPGALIVMILAIVMSAVLGWEEQGIHVVGEIPATLPDLGVPQWPGWDLMGDIVLGALAVIIVAFAESYAAADSYAKRFGYQIDANQEMIALGAANLGAGLSGGFVVDGSLSKTAAGVGAGQKTQMTSIITAIFTLITIVALTALFEPLPEAVLGAIVIHAVWKLIDFSTFRRLWNIRHVDFWLAIAAFLGVVLLDVLPGIMIGIILSLLALIYRSSFPQNVEIGRITDDEGNHAFVSLARNEDAEILAGLVLYRQNGPLIFSNASAFSEQARELLWSRTDPPARVLAVDCEMMSDLDVTGAEELLGLHEELAEADVEMYLVRLHRVARRTAERAGVIDAIGEDHVLDTVRVISAELNEEQWIPRPAVDDDDSVPSDDD